MDKSRFSYPVPQKNIRITDRFWSERLEVVRRNVIPYQYQALHDNIPGAEKSYAIENFKKAVAVLRDRALGKSVPVYPTDKWYYGQDAPEGAFHGWVFQDSDVYKWLEAVAYSLINHYDPQLFAQASEVIDLVCSAQMDNGYLDTLYIINDPSQVFTNLRDFHELYCFGHLTEAAVAFFEATQDRRLLDSAVRFADLLCRVFGDNGKKGYPGHEIAELALVKLYGVTGAKKYLDLAEFFICQRGTKPYYYDAEHNTKTDGEGYRYNQAHCQPRHQYEAVGHAVRGVYLYSGMADVARLCDDDGLYSACRRIWDNICNRKLYITGGIGATADGEAFSYDYDLPNDLAYSETCASIGLSMFACRMACISPESKYGDVMERALYNTILASMSSEGTEFFYVNPLEVLPIASHCDSRKRHVKPVRQKWFGCACCPPNLARFLTSLGTYCFSCSENTLYIHQYVGAEIDTDFGNVNIDSTYASDGKVSVTFSASRPCELALRIPGWCRDFCIDVPYTVRDGYAYVAVDGDMTISMDFGIRPRLVACSGKVRANVGKAAVAYGPMIYCAESVDNGEDLHLLSLDATADLRYCDGRIIAKGFRTEPREDLYYDYIPCDTVPVDITMIPYYTWGNRGENEMTVYISVAKKL